MTDRESSFLSRWSRRKRDPDIEPEPAAEADAPEASDDAAMTAETSLITPSSSIAEAVEAIARGIDSEPEIAEEPEPALLDLAEDIIDAMERHSFLQKFIGAKSAAVGASARGHEGGGSTVDARNNYVGLEVAPIVDMAIDVRNAI